MKSFVNFEGVAVPIEISNVDTDVIIPARFVIYAPDKAGYSNFLFHDLRFNSDGSEKSEFVLNNTNYRNGKILITAENFGCGSSRESAAYALKAYGIEVVISPSMGDFFYQNCVKNGLLPIVSKKDWVTLLRNHIQTNPGSKVSIDIVKQTVTDPKGNVNFFELDSFSKRTLISGQDEISYTQKYINQISEFESDYARKVPWMVLAKSGKDIV